MSSRKHLYQKRRDELLKVNPSDENVRAILENEFPDFSQTRQAISAARKSLPKRQLRRKFEKTVDGLILRSGGDDEWVQVRAEEKFNHEFERTLSWYANRRAKLNKTIDNPRKRVYRSRDSIPPLPKQMVEISSADASNYRTRVIETRRSDERQIRTTEMVEKLLDKGLSIKKIQAELMRIYNRTLGWYFEVIERPRPDGTVEKQTRLVPGPKVNSLYDGEIQEIRERWVAKKRKQT